MKEKQLCSVLRVGGWKYLAFSEAVQYVEMDVRLSILCSILPQMLLGFKVISVTVLHTKPTLFLAAYSLLKAFYAMAKLCVHC